MNKIHQLGVYNLCINVCNPKANAYICLTKLIN